MKKREQDVQPSAEDAAANFMRFGHHRTFAEQQ